MFPSSWGHRMSFAHLKDGCAGQESQPGHTCLRVQSDWLIQSSEPSLRVLPPPLPQGEEGSLLRPRSHRPLLPWKPLSEETPLDFWLPPSLPLSKVLMNPSNLAERSR